MYSLHIVCGFGITDDSFKLEGTAGITQEYRQKINKNNIPIKRFRGIISFFSWKIKINHINLN